MKIIKVCLLIFYMKRLQDSLGTLLSSLVYNRLNSESPSTDDGAYQPNFNLLDENNTNSFDSNSFFYICMILLLIVTLSSMISTRRRRRLGGNGSSFN